MMTHCLASGMGVQSCPLVEIPISSESPVNTPSEMEWTSTHITNTYLNIAMLGRNNGCVGYRMGV